MRKKSNAPRKRSLSTRPLKLSEYWLDGRWVHRPQSLPLTMVDRWGAIRNIPESFSKIPEYIESLPHPQLKEYVREHLDHLKKQSTWEMPISNNELKRWEKLRDQKQYKELFEEQAQKIEGLLLKNKDLIGELLKPDSLRKKIMDGFGIPYSPLLGLYSLTAYILVRLFGIKNEKLFEELLTHVKKVYTMRHGAPRGPDDQQERFSDLGTYLTEAIATFSKKPVLLSRKTSSLLVEGIERYLFTCVENAIKRDRMSEPEFEGIDVETLKSEPKLGLASIEEAKEAIRDLVLKDPINRIIAENYERSDSEIADIVYKRPGKRITKQAIRKRRITNIKPLIERSLELKMIMKEDENRIEEKTVRGAPGDGEALGEEEDGTENGV